MGGSGKNYSLEEKKEGHYHERNLSELLQDAQKKARGNG